MLYIILTAPLLARLNPIIFSETPTTLLELLTKDKDVKMMSEEAYTLNQADLTVLLNAIKETTAEHAIFLTTEIPNLQEDLILSEAKQTIEELEQIAIALEQNASISIALIEDFLMNRWERIRGSFLSYTGMPAGYINRCCLTFAAILHKIKPEKKKMQYLMPTLTHLIDQLDLFPDKQIDDYCLDEVILSEVQNALIPVQLLSFITPGSTNLSELHNPFVKSEEDTVLLLSEDEQKRLINHNKDTQYFFKLFTTILNAKLQSLSLGGKLFQLIQALKQGGKKGGHGGSEYNAGPDANIGIADFMFYWNSLSQEECDNVSSLRTNKETLGQIIKILQEGAGESVSSSITCVEINAGKLEDILNAHPELYNTISSNSKNYILALETEFHHYKNILGAKLSGSDKLKLLTPNLFENTFLFKEDNIIKLFLSLNSRLKNKKYTHQDLADIVKMYLKTSYCSPESLKAFDYVGKTALTGCFLNADIFKEIIASPHCTFEVLSQQNKDGDTALLYAIEKAGLEVVQAILASPYCASQLFMQKNKEGHTPLTLAVKGRKLNLISTIITSPYCTLEVLTQQNDKGENILTSAIDKGYVEIVQAILTSSLCNSQLLLQKSREGHTPLSLVVKKGNHHLAATIINSPHCTFEVLNQQNDDSDSALILAAGEGNEDITKTILASPYFNYQILNQKNQAGYTPLILATEKHKINIVTAILSNSHFNSIALNQCNNEGSSALMIAAERGIDDIIQAILASPHCDYHVLMQKNKSNYTPLHLAILNGRVNAVSLITTSSYCSSEILNQSTMEGSNALIMAVGKADAAIINIILASINFNKQVLMHQNRYGESALIRSASFIKNPKVMQTILNHPLCTLEVLIQCDEAGYSALIQAVKNHSLEMVKMILNSPYCTSQVLTQQTCYGYNALIEAVSIQQSEIAEVLLKSPYCSQELLIQQDRNGNTALIEAARLGELGIVKAILANPKCDYSVLIQKNKQGRDALDLTTDETIKTLINEKLLTASKPEEKMNIQNNKNLFFTPEQEKNEFKQMINCNDSLLLNN